MRNRCSGPHARLRCLLPFPLPRLVAHGCHLAPHRGRSPHRSLTLTPHTHLTRTSHTYSPPPPSTLLGAIAGLVLGGLLALSSLIGVCCRSKAATVSLLVLAVVCTAATVGCFYRFKSHTLDDEQIDSEYKFTYGFFGACVTFAVAFVTSVVSCCMSSKSDEYFELA